MASVFTRRVAGLALVAFLVSLSLPFVGGHRGFINDDSACGPDLLVGLGRATEIQAATAVVPAQHCAICHLQRATSGAAPAAGVGAIWTTAWSDTTLADDGRRVTSAALDRQPARAPPASFLI